MESKIEKIEVKENLRKIASARGQDTLVLVDKINEIIDHLNPQDQEEVMWETSEIELEEGMVIDTPDGKRKIGKTYTSKDTPEETESDVQEWEEEWHSTPVYNQISFIKNLLEEREREAYEKGYRKSEINNLEYRVYKIATERGYKEYHYYLDDRGFLVVEEVEELDKLKDKK